jgi:TetR/AcrR family transcriptional repressor of nem operon
MCLCGMLAAEFGTLPKPMREDMRHFFDENERWLVAVLQQGKRERALKFLGSAAEAAQTIIGTLEGAMMIARTYGDVARFSAASERVLKDLGA